MQYKPTDILIGEKLRELRETRRMSTRYVGKLIGRSNATICNYETGRNGVDIPTLKKLCNLYGVNMLDFLSGIYDKI